MTGRLTGSTPFVMSESEAESLVRRYPEFITGDSASNMSEILAEDFLDHVSGQRGNVIWDMVDEWRRATFANAETEIHELLTEAVVREVNEETGLLVERIDPLGRSPDWGLAPHCSAGPAIRAVIGPSSR